MLAGDSLPEDGGGGDHLLQNEEFADGMNERGLGHDAELDGFQMISTIVQSFQALTLPCGEIAADDVIEQTFSQADDIVMRFEQEIEQKIGTDNESDLNCFVTAEFLQRQNTAEKALVGFILHSHGLAQARAILSASSLLHFRVLIMAFTDSFDASSAHMLNSLAASCIDNIKSNIGGILAQSQEDRHLADDDVAVPMQAASASLGLMIEGVNCFAKSHETSRPFSFASFCPFFDAYAPVLEFAISCTTIAKNSQVGEKMLMTPVCGMFATDFFCFVI